MATLTVRLAQLGLTVVQGAAVAIWNRLNTTTGASIPGGASYVFTDINGIATIVLPASGAGEVYEVRIIIRGDVKLAATFAMPGTDAYLDELDLNVDDDSPAPGTPVTAGVSTLSNQGGGAGLFMGLVSTVAQLRTLIAGDGVSITSNGNTITITSTAPAGPAGAAGTNGTNGADGLSAYDIAVSEGFSGTESQWLDSLRGPQGIQGETGNTGAAGQSAYALAVALGFVGTEAQWIASLKGVKGDIGDDGPPGETGPAGPAGPAGPTGLQGAQGDSAYQIAVNAGFVGTQAEWLSSLIGESGITGWDLSNQVVSCAYPLNLTEADAISAGYAGIPAMSANFTLATYAIKAGRPTTENYVALSGIMSASPVDDGNRVIEWALTSEALSGGAGATALKVRVGLIDKTTPANVVGVLEFDLKDDGVITATLITDLGASTAVTLVSMPDRVSIAFDAVAGTIAVRLDDVAQSFSADAYTATADATPEIRFTEAASVSTGLLGKSFSARQYTAAHEITGTHAAGAMDMCGHVLGDGALPAGANAVLMVSQAGTYKGESYTAGKILVVNPDGVTVQAIDNGVLQYADLAAFPASGADATLYIAADTGLVYRWGGAAYAAVGLQPIADQTILGNVSGSTATPVALTKTQVRELVGVKAQFVAMTTPNQAIVLGADTSALHLLGPGSSGITVNLGALNEGATLVVTSEVSTATVTFSKPAANHYLQGTNGVTASIALQLEQFCIYTFTNVNGKILAGKSLSNAVSFVSTFTPVPVTSLFNAGALHLPATIQRSVTTNTTAGGNSRGIGAVDFQRVRGAATQVASGSDSFLFPGDRNTASSTLTAAGGYQTSVSGQYSFAYSMNGSVTGQRAFLLGGAGGTASGYNGGQLGGDGGNITSGYRAIGIGGGANTASAQDSVYIGGYGANVSVQGAYATGAGLFSKLKQRLVHIAGEVTTGATPKALISSTQSDAVFGGNVLRSAYTNATLLVSGRVLGVSGAEHKAMRFDAVLVKTGTTYTVGWQSFTVINETAALTTASAAFVGSSFGWELRVTGIAATTIDWVSETEALEQVR